MWWSIFDVALWLIERLEMKDNIDLINKFYFHLLYFIQLQTKYPWRKIRIRTKINTRIKVQLNRKRINHLSKCRSFTRTRFLNQMWKKWYTWKNLKWRTQHHKNRVLPLVKPPQLRRIIFWMPTISQIRRILRNTRLRGLPKNKKKWSSHRINRSRIRETWIQIRCTEQSKWVSYPWILRIQKTKKRMMSLWCRMSAVILQTHPPHDRCLSEAMISLLRYLK